MVADSLAKQSLSLYDQNLTS